MAPEKGLHVLCDAVARMTEPVELRVAGFLPAEWREYLADLQKQYRFVYKGSPDREGKLRFLQSIDVLSVPSTYDEPKGIFLLEAMANGAPVVQPRKGAYTEIIEKTGGGILVAADDPGDLARVLDELARDRSRLRNLAASAVKGVQAYSIEAAAAQTLGIYGTVASHFEAARA
ncbi:MAG: glycosyltransferase family 4 protein [Bryobacteraceae bacterium]